MPALTFTGLDEPVESFPNNLRRVCLTCGYTAGQHYGSEREGHDCPVMGPQGRTVRTAEPRAMFWRNIPGEGEASSAITTSRARVLRGRILGYTRDADVYCPACTAMTYAVPPRTSVDQPLQDDWGIPEGTLDGEGNPVHPIMSTDEQPEQDENCRRCAQLIRIGRLCECGDGCAAGDCGNCDDDGISPTDTYTDDDGAFGDGCSCIDCVAASEYTGPVE